MKPLTRTLVGGIAAGAMALAAASPAQAQSSYRHYDRDRGISAGDVIAGALIIGGIAAIASAASRDRDDRYRGRGYDRRYYNDPRSAIEQCVNSTERAASRHSWGGRAEVTDIRDVDSTSKGYKIKGRIAVNQMGRDWRRGDPRYGRGWGNDYRGWQRDYAGWDSGKFTCKIEYGRVVDLDYSGIRGL